MIDFSRMRFVRSAMEPVHFPNLQKPEFAFSGRSNVGKSSLINMICKSTIARVSKTPGRTQAINFFEIQELVFADLPGYGFAKVSKALRQQWKSLIENYLEQRKELRLIVWIIDARREIDEPDLMYYDWLKYYRRKLFLVLNKIDKIPKNELQKVTSRIIKAFPDEQFSLCSVLKHSGRDQLAAAILDELKKPQ
ncbi:MAG: ribosome biogenesis GTP-binding protein YihA/YsxC [Candidatus Wallbacteria bacterium]|nr:ribosome biogenesis GTP-binding protein YihA/YsxC [Candidatus Wallbacteria bacterium]